MLTPGTIIGDRYEIIEKIGAGGMSIVYKARCNRLQRFVAIKVLREEFVTDEDFVAKFRKEALAAASLSHPNIVGIYDVGSDHELHYIVMEFIEGKTLKDLIAEEGPFNSRMVLDFGVQMASALKHAHKKKIIHRDIKPQNILVTHDNVLKVTDFGIAKAVDSSTIVATGNAIGSVHYFSPEQAKGKYVNETSDLYSCGIVLFELSTQKLPFEADSHISIALKHINEEMPHPSIFNPSIQPNLEKLILKATSKSQSQRYQNADEMLKDMKGILTNPDYIVKENDVTENTILLSDLDTDLIRNGGGKTAGSSKPISSGRYTEMPALEAETEEEEGLSTFYKVLVSVGGVLAALVIVTILSVALYFGLPGLGKTKEVTVPNLTGQTVEQAQNLLKSYKLQLTVVGEEASDAVPVNTILKQSPEENKVVKPNTVIEVTLAKAVVVEEIKPRAPDLIGLKIADAEKLLKDNSIYYRIDKAYDDSVPEGEVIDQTPNPGTEMEKDTKMTVIVSKGPETVMAIVPNLANMTLDAAAVSLRNEKLKMGKKTEEANDVVPKGLIINQSIRPNQEVKEGTAIDVVVSSGKKEEIPPVESKPSDNLTSVSKSINIPETLVGKDVYHVLVRLLAEDGSSKDVFDGQITKDQFPLNVSVQGRGTGTLETYFDGQLSYQDPIDFNGVQ